MLRAKKRNRTVLIPEDKRADYEGLGYTITDAEGNVLSEPKDIEGENRKLRKENRALKKENALLRQKIGELTTLMNNDR